MIIYQRDRHTVWNTNAKCANYSTPIINKAMPPLADYNATLNYVTSKDDAPVGNDAMLVDDRIRFVIREDLRWPLNDQPGYIPVRFR